MYRDPIVYADSQPEPLKCPVCHITLEVRLSKGRRSGKPFIMPICPVDGRHFRAFINDKNYVAQVLAKLEDKA